jgi:Asp/Glu/hydantoin racemase
LRILLINPNTTAAVTALVANRARAIAGDEATFVPVTGRFGTNYISTRASAAIAAHAALEALAQHVAGCDAVYLACFGDPGLAALREISPVPVVGMAEASCLEACNRGRRFAIVTGGALWGPMRATRICSIEIMFGRVTACRFVFSSVLPRRHRSLE